MIIMIHFKEISKTFRSELLGQPFQALTNVSFDVPEGSMVGFLGANGAGKTTSLKIIMDFIRPTSGEVIFSSSLGKNQQEVFRNIGFLPERPYFYQNLTGFEFLHFMGNLSDINKSVVNERISHWAPRFKIDHALNRELKTYSKGMLQRIGFLATILHEPKIIILDEPLSGLDPIGRKELKDVIIEVHRAGKTVFFSSHIVPDIEEICDRVIFLKNGTLAYDGSVSELMKQGKSQDFVITVKHSGVIPESIPAKEILSLPDDLKRVTLSEENKDLFLKYFLTSGSSIIGVEMIKPRLEEIFYNTRNVK
jgi:ABC-2 type transport system ATP-binding protein